MKTQIESPHPVLLEVKNLKKHFQVKVPNHETQTVHALNGISFLLHEGETLGLVGESGCGKSTAARAILRLVEPTSGEVFYRNHNLITLKQNKLRSLRKEMQIIFQDPLASLNPRKLIKKILEEPFDIQGFSKSKEKDLSKYIFNETKKKFQSSKLEKNYKLNLNVNQKKITKKMYF